MNSNKTASEEEPAQPKAAAAAVLCACETEDSGSTARRATSGATLNTELLTQKLKQRRGGVGGR